ncbi:MAG TPA: NAD-dependent epimerase/dehydratase family protein [Ornithinimicrobium sp.]|uniref:NAD-dependent epimerase/dehydratase family protein n=1 Tax=Ornithinimicrobium sp. TaxID=1977084 RepID=UPI002B473E24|nr:NAD-dependent epimerase/dehydratase family protein [Ornithinimicrobium sp.]HKJ13099.1 NAD-dependent epimerase/dehydratase family protein [Ornithinimicrobium sp.]
MRVLVTGASGMLGGAVADLLAAQGNEVVVMQRRTAGGRHREVLGDVTDAVAVGRAVEGAEAVVHLAAKVDVVGRWVDYRATNVDGTRHLLDAARAAGVGKVVYVSSPSVAHSGASIVGEGSAPADDQARSHGHYARSKAMAERLALDAHGPDLAVAAIRPHLVWGPGDTQLVGRIVDRARRGRLVLVGSGAALVDSTYVDNAAEAIVAALRRIDVAAGQALVVTNGEPRPIGELVSDICRACGAPPPRHSVPYPVAWAVGGLVEGLTAASHRLPVVPPIQQPPVTRFLAGQLSTAHWFDQQRTREVLDWTPRVSLSEGLARLRDHHAGQSRAGS